MGNGQSTTVEDGNLFSEYESQPVPSEIIEVKKNSRRTSCLVKMLSNTLRVKSDLDHSLHQLAELGNTEILELKAKEEDVNQLDTDQLAPLHYAARYNHLETVKILLQNNADVNIRGQDDRTPLHYAARCRTNAHQICSMPCKKVDDLEFMKDVDKKNLGIDSDEKESMVILLKNHKADVNAQDKYGQTPLHFAAMAGNMSAATDLVNCHANVEIEDNQLMTPLIIAASSGCVDLAQLLLEEAGANMRQVDFSDQSALHRGAKGGHLGMVKLLLRLGKSMKKFECFLNAKDSKGKTPLYHACSNGHGKVASQLLNAGADVFVVTETLATPLHAAAGVGSVEIIDLLLELNVKLNVADLYQRTPLMNAAAGNHIEAIKVLASKGADLDHQDMNKSSALLLAAQSGHAEAIKLLLDLGVNVNATDKFEKTAVYLTAENVKAEALTVLMTNNKCRELLDNVDCYGRPPLHIAVLTGNIPVVDILLRSGATVSMKNEEQDTVLHLAARKGYNGMLLKLIPLCRSMINADNEDLDTPLHLACKWGHDEVVKVLLEAGADVASKNASSSTPLHLAAQMGYANCCQLLLDADTYPDVFNKDHKTPLMLAVLQDHVAVTRLLLEHGASLSPADKKGMNALQLAIEAGKRDVASAIVQSPSWKAALKKVTQDEEGQRITPFRMLIEKLPDVAEDVLNRCLETNHRFFTDQEDTTVEMNFEYIDDTYQPNSGLGHYDKEGHLESLARPYTRNARLIKNNHPLMLMIKHRRSSLLAHPVCVMLIKHKWEKYGRIMYYSNLAWYLVFLFFLTFYVLSVRQLNWIAKTDSEGSPISGMIDAKTCQEVNWNIWNGISFLVVCKWVILSISIVEMIKEISQLWQARTAYLCGDNMVEWACYVCALLFVMDFDREGCPLKEEWQWQVGATAIFLSWMNLLLFIRVFPYFGIYIIMFTEILTTFSSFSVVFLLFIVAFALSFYTVLGTEHGFNTPSHSILRTSVMMMGEINYEGIFIDPERLAYPEVTYLLVIGFLIFMSILIMNLLVGLAVDDIKAVQEEAALTKLAMQTKLVMDLEMVIPEWIRRRYFLRKLTIENNKSKSFLGRLLKKFHFYQGKEVSEIDKLRQEVTQLRLCVNELAEMKTSLTDLAELKSSLSDMNHLKIIIADIHRHLSS